MPRKKIDPFQKATQQFISFAPAELDYSWERASLAGGLSKYIRTLVRYDRRHNLLPQALREDLELKSAQKKVGAESTAEGEVKNV